MWWVDVDNFYHQMCELKYRKVVFLDDYEPGDQDQVVITFDGIYSDILKYAVPILRDFGFPFELFVTGDYVGKDNSFDGVEPRAAFASTEELRELVEAGGRLQWHTRTHQNLKGVSDRRVIAKELLPPNNLREIDQRGFGWIAYPNGDFNDIIIEEAKKLFKGGVSCNQGNDVDQFKLNRIIVTNETSFQKAAIAAIIASYNYGCFLIEALESVLRQTRPVDEIVIADDNSDDNTMEIALEYQKKYPDLIKYYRNDKRLGIVKNFNKAVSLASSDYICFLGADNRFRSDYVEKTAEILDADDKVGIAYTDFALFGKRARVEYERFGDARKGPVKENYYYIINFPDFSEETRQLLDKSNFMHGSSMYRRRAFEQVGGYKEEKGSHEDHNLFLRMIKDGWKAERSGFPLLEYRQHSREQANVGQRSANELNFYKEQFCKKNRQIEEQAQKIQSKDRQIESLLNSYSWKITAPLRRLWELLRNE